MIVSVDKFLGCVEMIVRFVWFIMLLLSVFDYCFLYWEVVVISFNNEVIGIMYYVFGWL